MEIAQVVGIALTVAGALASLVWTLVQREMTRQASAIEKRATISALESAEERHREEMKDMRLALQTALADVNRRQDREIDALNTSINRVDHGVAELRKEMTSANARISQGLQDVLSSVQRGRRSHE